MANEALILDVDTALRIAITVQNGAISVQWKDEMVSDVYDQRLFAHYKEAILFIEDMLEKNEAGELIPVRQEIV
jgi:hypothetical protein